MPSAKVREEVFMTSSSTCTARRRSGHLTLELQFPFGDIQIEGEDEEERGPPLQTLLELVSDQRRIVHHSRAGARSGSRWSYGNQKLTFFLSRLSLVAHGGEVGIKLSDDMDISFEVGEGRINQVGRGLELGSTQMPFRVLALDLIEIPLEEERKTRCMICSLCLRPVPSLRSPSAPARW